MADRSAIEALIGDPCESLSVELKRWIDPASPAGIEKIAKGAIALRNRNGGYLVIGFDDKTCEPDTENEPPNAKTLFHIDVIQGIISKYSSDPFEVEVVWGARDGRDYPVIVIPSGVKVPVAAKRDLLGLGSRTGIKNGAVYVRTLSSNGTASTAQASPSDWSHLVNICFDNKEADITRFLLRFLPRHLPPDVAKAARYIVIAAYRMIVRYRAELKRKKPRH